MAMAGLGSTCASVHVKRWGDGGCTAHAPLCMCSPLYFSIMPHNCMKEDEKFTVLPSTASNAKWRHRKGLRRKPAGAPSVESSSMRSGMSGFRLKGAFLAGWRGSPNTPVPKWKVHHGGRMPLCSDNQQGHHHHRAYHDYDHPSKSPRGPAVSARKLGASLWELQELPFSRGGASRMPKDMHTHKPLPMNGHANTRKFMHVRPFSPVSSMGSHFRASMKSKQWRHASSFDRTRIYRGASKAEIGSTPRDLALGFDDISAKLNSGGHMTTNELVKVLHHLWSLEERHACNMSLVAALRAELDQARVQLQELLLKEEVYSKEVQCVTQRMVEERALWQEQHEKSVRVTFLSISQELENERKAKEKLELLHRKAEKELRDTRRKLGTVLQELEKERKARELMEEVCDELAMEIGEDKARVEELRRESMKVREEVEEERKMLQMAEMWREERVQMKLMEAKLELEEKNTALDKLRGELETFLKAKRGNDGKEEASLSQHTYKHSLDASSGHSLADASRLNTQKGFVSGRKSVDSVKQSASRVYPDGDGSDDEDDLHSIELNRESFVMPGSTHFGPHSSQQHGFIHKGRKSVDQRLSTAPMTQQQTSERFNDKLQGYESVRDQVAKERNGEVGAEKDGLYDHAQVSEWIERSFEGGEMQDWRLEQEEPVQRGREECIKPWQRTNGRSHELVSSSPRKASMKVTNQFESPKPRGPKCGPSNDSRESIFSRNQSVWLQRVFEFENVHSTPMFDNGHEGSKVVSSPTHQWTNR